MLHSTRQDAWDIATLNSPKIHMPGASPYANIHRAAVDSCFFRVMEQGMVPNWIDEVEASHQGRRLPQEVEGHFVPAANHDHTGLAEGVGRIHRGRR